MKTFKPATNSDVYYRRLKNSKFEFPCCDLTFPPLLYIKHIVQCHAFVQKLYCPWCRIPFENEGGKKANLYHLSFCFWNLTSKMTASPPPPPPKQQQQQQQPIPQASSNTHDDNVCRTCLDFDSDRERLQYYNHIKDPEELPLLTHITTAYSIYTRFWYLALFHWSMGGPEPFPFDRASGLGPEVAETVLLYQYLLSSSEKEYVWKHIYIKKSALRTLDNALRNTDVAILPFGCMCNGGGEPHAHLIAVGRKKTFHLFWNRIHRTCIVDKNNNNNNEKTSGKRKKKRRNSPSKGSEIIVSVFHLINTIFYVGKRRSNCSGKLPSGAVSRLMHYLLLRPLPPHAKLYAYMLVDGGWFEWEKMMMGHCDLYGLDFKTNNAVLLKDMKRHTSNVFERCYVPLLSGYREIEEEEEGCFILYGPKPIYFKKVEGSPPMDKKSMFEESVATGKSFNERFLNTEYRLSVNQNRIANNLKQDRAMLQQSAELDRLRWMARHESEMLVLKNENVVQKSKINELESKITDLMAEMASLKTQKRETYSTKIFKLKEQNYETLLESLKHQNTQMAEEMAKLKDQNAKILEENAVLKDQMAKLAEENAKLKDQVTTFTWEKKMSGLREELIRFEMKLDKYEAVMKVMDEKFEAVFRILNERLDDKNQIITNMVDTLGMFKTQLVDYMTDHRDLKDMVRKMVRVHLGEEVQQQLKRKKPNPS